MNTRVHLSHKLIALSPERLLLFTSRRFSRGRWRPAKGAATLALAAGLMGVLLSPPADAVSVVWTGAAAGTDRNWSTSGNWSGGTPRSTNSIFFNSTDAQTTSGTVNNYVDQTFAVSSLSYTNVYTNTAAYLSFQNTAIQPGQTLTVTNGLTVGVGTSASYQGSPYTYATISGAGGSLAVTGGNVQVGYQSSSAATLFLNATLDMSTLGAFTYSVPTGTFGVAAATQRRQTGVIHLAGTNLITASQLGVGVGTTGAASGPGALHLGATNVINADIITFGKNTEGDMDFRSGLTSPTLKIRGSDGVSGVGTNYIAWTQSTSISVGSGTNDLSAGIVDAVITNLYVAYHNNIVAKTTSGGLVIGPASGNVLSVQNLTVGACPGAATAAGAAVGTVTVQGGTFTAGSVVLGSAVTGGTGTGTLNLSGGNFNAGTVALGTVSGGTASGIFNLSGGTMQVTGDITAGTSTCAGVVSNATLNVGGRIGTAANYLNSLTVKNATLALKLIGGSNPSAFVSTLAVNGPTVIAFSSDNLAVGQFPIIAYSGGDVQGTSGFGGLSVSAPPGVTASLVDNTANQTVDVLITAVPALKWTGTVNGNWNIGGTTNWKSGSTPATYNEPGGVGNAVLFDDSGITTTVNLTTTLSPGALTLQNTNKDYTFSGSGKLSGTGGLTKLAAGKLTLANSGQNDFAGSTLVSGGTLQVGNGGLVGSLGAGLVQNDALLVFNRSDDVNVANALSGGGTLEKQGANTLTLQGVTTYSGTLQIDAGTLALSPSGAATVGSLSGSGNLVKTGSGTVILTGNSDTFSGPILISAGTLQAGNGGSAGLLGTGDVTDNATLTFNRNGSVTVPNNITGSGQVQTIGSGTLAFNGALSYTGSTTVQNGTLQVGTPNVLPTGTALTLGDASGGLALGNLDLTSFSQTVGALTAGGNQVAAANQIVIGSGQTLTVNGNVNIGNTAGSGAKIKLFVTGADGTLAVNTNGGTMQLGLSTAGGGIAANLVLVDLSGLGAFAADLGASGSLQMGERAATGGTGAPTEVLNLAATNSIRAGTISIGPRNKGVYCTFVLGSVTNLLNSDTINLGTGPQSSGNLQFYTSSGSVMIRGYAGGSSRAALNIGTSSSNDTSGESDLCNVSGHYADLMLGTLTMGNLPLCTAAWTQTFSFDQGLLDVTNVAMSKACHSGTTGASLMNLGGGLVNLGHVSLSSSIAAGTLNITGGSVTVGGAITKPGSGAGTVSVANATLQTAAIGTVTNPVNVVSLNSATLSLALAGAGNPTSAPVQAVAFSADGACTLAFSGAGLTTGQFPLVAYSDSIGGSGFSALTLVSPPGVTATLVDNSANHSVDVLVTAVAAPTQPPTLSSIAQAGLNSFVLGGTGGSNQTYNIYASTNVAAPMSSWWLVGTTNASAGGVINFIDTQATNEQRFYRFGQ